MNIFTVNASHPFVPGDKSIPCSSRGAANRKAAELANVIRKDMLSEFPDIPEATPNTWRQTVDVIEIALGNDTDQSESCIYVEEQEVFE